MKAIAYCVCIWVGIVSMGMAAVTLAVPTHGLDFIRGDKPPADARSNSLHLGGCGGLANGLQPKGIDGNQILVVRYTDGLYSRGVLQEGDVILGVNGKLFESDVIDTWRAAVAEAPLHAADGGNLRIIRWRDGVVATVDFLTILPPPDLTRGETNTIDTTYTYNLGATGLRGWIYTKADTDLDRGQGRTTQSSRQILVTHVGTNSPASGMIEVNDIILGVNGKPFSDDARKSFAWAITESEKTGNLDLLRFRAGGTERVQLTMNILGAYSGTAPYDCAKSRAVFEAGCKVLGQESLNERWNGAITALAMLASGKPGFLPKLQAYARGLVDHSKALKQCSTWDWGYINLFLCEYYLATHDKEVLPAIQAYTVALARSQSLYGTFGHGGSELTEDGKLHGSIPPYGPVNMAGLPANLSIVMGAKCGVNDPEVPAAIGRASRFFGYFVDKGAIPYGEHMPAIAHENNGKSPITALLFGLQGDKSSQTRYFTRMSVAAYANRECGHTGQGFSYLWCMLGPALGGPEAAAAYFKQVSWHLDLVRRCDGSFTYDGQEQFGPGRTDDNTYYGKSSYYGLSPNATYVLLYSLPLRTLYITGKEPDKANWLGKQDIDESIAAGRFDLDRTSQTPRQLVAAFASWSPAVRSWAAGELARRPEARGMVPDLIELTNSSDGHVRQGACETLGYLKDTNALPVLVSLLCHPDRWLRAKAAQALRCFGDAARPALPGMLQAVADTAEPIDPIEWADPIQFTQSELAASIFSGMLRSRSDGIDRVLLYPAIKAVARNANGTARAQLANLFQTQLALEDVRALGPALLDALYSRAPADTMGCNVIRMGAYQALTKHHFKEGIDAAIAFAKTQGGHGSEVRTVEIMKQLTTYGTAACRVVPELKQLISQFNYEYTAHSFPGPCNIIRVTAVEQAIQAIEASTNQPPLLDLIHQ